MPKERLTSILKKKESINRDEVHDILKRHDLSEKTDKITDILNVPDVDILNDLPATEDALGFDALARTISSIILSETTDTPITICIDGAWGSGKTSLLKLIEAQARMFRVHCVWINAWNIETKEDMIANIRFEIEGIYEQIDKEMTEKLEKELPEDYSNYKMEIERATQKLSQWGKPSILGFNEIIQKVISLDAGIRKSASTRLLIFIDDIDRTFPGQIANLFKTLKLFLESPHCVFIMAMDINIVASYLQNYYQDRTQNIFLVNTNLHDVKSQEVNLNVDQSKQPQNEAAKFGYSYLEKLIQIHFEVPSLTRESVANYLSEAGVIDDILEIIHWTPDADILNPRRLKRYVNWLSVSLQLVNSTRISCVSSINVLRLMALRRNYPVLYSKLKSDMSFNIKAIETALSVTKDEMDSLEASNGFNFIIENIDDFARYLKKISHDELMEFDKNLSIVPVLNSKHNRL